MKPTPKRNDSLFNVDDGNDWKETMIGDEKICSISRINESKFNNQMDRFMLAFETIGIHPQMWKLSYFQLILIRPVNIVKQQEIKSKKKTLINIEIVIEFGLDN